MIFTQERIREAFGALLLAQPRTRLLLAFLAGASGALAQAPFDLLPAFFVTFTLLVWLLDAVALEGRGGGADVRAAFTLGWSFGFGYFLATLWWLGQAFIARGAEFIWLMPLGVVALPMGLAIFFGLGVVIARVLWSPGAARLFALAFGLGVSEWLRGWILTGFPWNSFGQAFANHLVLAQGMSVIGSEGVGLFVPLVFGAPAVLLSGTTRGGRYGLPVFAALLMSLLAGFGLWRLETNGGVAVDFSRQKMVEGVRLRLVQPAIPQDEKWSGQNGPKMLERFLALSDAAKGPHASGVADVTHLIWPESPFPFVLDRTPQAMRAITTFLPASTTLITGAIRTEVDAGGTRYFNTLHVIDKSGIKGTYDKVHLVPFGEYLPFERVLRAMGLEQFVHVIGGFTPARMRRSLHVPGLPTLVPLICFEAIFPHEVAPAIDGSSTLVTLTNDAWFGATPGPYQHLAQARLRAIEFGQPMVRVANSGISAVIDGYGRMIAHLPLGVADVLDSPLPAGTTKTLYRLSLWYSFAPVMIWLLVVAGLGRIRSALAHV
jgi:apolipoprotein N-acyltransferase